MKVVRNFLKLFWNCFLVERFRWTFCRAEGSLALPQPKGACVAPTKGWSLVAEFDGNCWELMEIDENWWKLLEIGGNWWKLVEIAGNLWKLMKICGNWWKFVEIKGNLWKLVEIVGNCRKSMKILIKNFRDPKVVQNFLTDF